MDLIMDMDMDPRTTLDLRRLEEIRIARSKLYDEKILIKKNCPCHDYVASIEETLAFDITPQSICPVCKKPNGELTLDEKIECLREYYAYDEDAAIDEESLRRIAVAGGANHFDSAVFEKEAECIS